MNKSEEIEFIENTLKEIETAIVSMMDDIYNNIFNHSKLDSLEPSYSMESIKNAQFSESLSLSEYLFFKSKSYALEYLLTIILILKDKQTANYENLPIKEVIVPTTFKLNNAIFYESESIDHNLKSAGLYKKNTTLTNQIGDIINSFEGIKSFNVMDRSSPYLFFKNAYQYSFDYDFFHKDAVFFTTFCENQKTVLLPKSFTEYISLLTHLMYTSTKRKISASSNLIKLSNTILAYIEKDAKFSQYKKIDNLVERMNSDINQINIIYEELDSDKSKSKHYAVHHLINTYYHNQFFNSISHPLIKVIFKRIDMKELFNVIILDNSSYSSIDNEWVNVSEDQTMIEHYSIKESAYYLRLLELLMKYNIDFYQITFDDLYYLKITNEEILKQNNNGSYSHHQIKAFKSNRYNFLKEQELLFEITINFIYDYLEEYENSIYDLINLHIDTIENISQGELSSQNSCHILNGLIERINQELDDIYNLIPDELEFNEIGTDKDYDQYYYILREYPFLFTYLIKQGFIKG